MAATNTATNQEVAIKQIQNAYDCPGVTTRYLREIQLMRQLVHSNILGILDLQADPEATTVYIVTERMETDLSVVIRDQHQLLTADHWVYFQYQLLCGLKYLHSAGVMHRDIKPANLLVDGDCALKICDFGLGRETAVRQGVELTEYVVTRWYRAPEIMLGSLQYGAGVDMWAAGCVLAEMLLGEPLFPGATYKHMLQLMGALLGRPSHADMAGVTNQRARAFLLALPPQPCARMRGRLERAAARLSPHAMPLLLRLLTWDPSARISAKEALCDPLFAVLHHPVYEPVAGGTFALQLPPGLRTRMQRLQQLETSGGGSGGSGGGSGNQEKAEVNAEWQALSRDVTATLQRCMAAEAVRVRAALPERRALLQQSSEAQEAAGGSAATHQQEEEPQQPEELQQPVEEEGRGEASQSSRRTGEEEPAATTPTAGGSCGGDRGAIRPAPQPADLASGGGDGAVTPPSNTSRAG